MSRMHRYALAAAAGFMGLFISDTNLSSLQQSSLITQADARVGRPMTATSVAGVARRSTRRTVRRGAYYGAAAVGAGAAYYGTSGYGGGCYRARNAYGRLVTVCR
jgi:hypothetical protein